MRLIVAALLLLCSANARAQAASPLPLEHVQLGAFNWSAATARSPARWTRIVAGKCLAATCCFSKHLVKPEALGLEANPLDRHASRWLRWRD